MSDLGIAVGLRKLGAILGMLAACGIATAVALADGIDADVVAAQSGNQTTRDLGTVAPGATLTPPVSFQLNCAGNKHVDANQAVQMTFDGAVLDSSAVGTSIVSATDSTINAPGASWPDDGDNNCTGMTSLIDNGDSTVTIHAPMSSGLHTVVVSYDPVFSVAGSDDPSSITGSTTVTFTFTVANLDTDGDGVNDASDNCPTTPNSNQLNTDGDSQGDACDGDDDNDGVADGTDNCQIVSNADQANTDGDSQGDACDLDDDNDGVLDDDDNCQLVANASQVDNDGDGLGQACDSNDFAPAVGTAASAQSGNEGDELSASGSFTDGDPNGAATLTITKKSGVGTVTPGPGGTWSWSYTPTDDTSSPQTVEVQASDGEHTNAVDSFTWSAANVDPTATPHAPTNVNEGSNFNLSLSDVIDPGTADTHTYAFDCGNGTYNSSNTPSTSCSTTDDATLSVGLKVIDDDGGFTAYTPTVHVVNVAPSSVTASFGSSLSCAAAANAELSWSFVDPGSDTWDAQIDWDYDGTAFAPDETKTNVAKAGSATHPYGSAGTHTAAIKILDDDGGVSSLQTATLVVNYNLSSILQPVNDTRNGQPASMFKHGSTVPVKVQITNCDGSHPSNLDVRVTYAKTASNPPLVGTDEAVATNAPDGGNQMRFSDPIYIFNFGTKNVNDSSSTLRIDVSIRATGQYTYAHIGLKAK